MYFVTTQLSALLTVAVLRMILGCTFLAGMALSPCYATEEITQTIFVDTSWRAIGPVGDLTGQGIDNVGLAWEASNIGWNTDVNFDASDLAGWTDTIEVTHPNPPFLRHWVDGTETVGSSPAYFRRVFNITGLPTIGLLDFAVDDDAKVFVNGQLVFDDSNSLATAVNNINVLPHLQSGLNLIAVKAQDQQGAQAISGRLDIVSTIPEPTTLTLTALGLFGLVARGRRRRER